MTDHSSCLLASPPTPEPFVIAEQLVIVRENAFNAGYIMHEDSDAIGMLRSQDAASGAESRILSEWSSQSSRIETLTQENARLMAGLKAESGVDQERSTATAARDASVSEDATRAEEMLRRHAAMYDWTKKEAVAINDFILSVREGIAEEWQPIPHTLLKREGAKIMDAEEALAVELAAIDLESSTGFEQDHWRTLIIASLTTLRRGGIGEWAEFCACGVYFPDVTDGIADHKGECRALAFKEALRLLALGADDTYGWNTANLEQAQRLLDRYPRLVSDLHERGLPTSVVLAVDRSRSTPNTNAE